MSNFPEALNHLPYTAPSSSTQYSTTLGVEDTQPFLGNDFWDIVDGVDGGVGVGNVDEGVEPSIPSPNIRYPTGRQELEPWLFPGSNSSHLVEGVDGVVEAGEPDVGLDITQWLNMPTSSPSPSPPCSPTRLREFRRVLPYIANGETPPPVNAREGRSSTRSKTRRGKEYIPGKYYQESTREAVKIEDIWEFKMPMGYLQRNHKVETETDSFAQMSRLNKFVKTSPKKFKGDLPVPTVYF